MATPYVEPDYRVEPETWRDDEISYAWLGHATVLINFYGTVILTDPVLFERIGPPEIFNNLFGIKRISQLPVELEDLPVIDLVIISHSHFDHLDLASLSYLKEKHDYTLVVPALTRDLVSEQAANVIELDWLSRANKSIAFKNMTLRAFRVEHYSYVNWGERDTKRGFNGYLIHSKQSNKKIAFFGDTSYSRYRDEQGNMLNKPVSIDWRDKFDPGVLQSGIDLCIIPIGDAYYYWNHISPEQAVQLAHELHCKKLLPIHYSTFVLTPPDKVPVKPGQKLLRVLSNNNDMDLVRCQTLHNYKEFPLLGISCKLQ